MRKTFTRLAKTRARWTLLLSFVLLSLVTAPALATTVLQLSFSEVVDHAELIFEGHVRKVETIQTGPRSIHTRVTFDIINVIKGSYPAPEVSLQFLGGEVDGRRLVVEGMQVPETGDTGIFFVESLQEALIHPLVGWSQGHFLLERDTRGESRVLTAGHAPVTGLAITPLVEPTPEISSEALEDSMRILTEDGAAHGVISDQTLPAQAAMSASDFRAQIQLMLELQQQVP